MADAFQPGQADFSAMTTVEPMCLFSIFHQAFLTIDEKGTEAAAAAALMGGFGGVRGDTIVFRADHPFVFLIQDRDTGAILFMGRIVDPRG
jgi:serpin B